MRADPRAACAAALLALAALPAGAADVVALPLQCLPAAVPAWSAALPNPDSRFGATGLPGIVLGPPGDSTATTNSTTVASLGNGGTMTFRLDGMVIEDRPGPDFIVFENAFFVGAAPLTPADDYRIFDEPGIVEVSADGTAWFRFPYDAAALAQAKGQNIGPDLFHRLRGLAGITPTFTGNWTVPDDPDVWDAAGTGGVSGAGGDAFDLATVGLSSARFVRITDALDMNGPAGSAEGFDLDALVVLHGRPAGQPGVDTDGDGLPDLAEQKLYGTDPARADSDNDGTDDGREVTGCRNPLSAATAAWMVSEPRVWLRGNDCTEVRWTFLGSPARYDLARGDVAALHAGAGAIDLGATTCLVTATSAVRYACDATKPAAGHANFYVVRTTGAADWGRASSLAARHAASGCL